MPKVKSVKMSDSLFKDSKGSPLHTIWVSTFPKKPRVRFSYKQNNIIITATYSTQISENLYFLFTCVNNIVFDRNYFEIQESAFLF